MDWKNNVVEMAILPKAIQKFNEIFIKIPKMSVAEVEKTNAEIHTELQKRPESKSNREN